MSRSNGPTQAARSRGSLLGLAIGDALGTTIEFSVPGRFEPVTDIVGGGSFALDPGQWTDDTSMALCLAESIIETGWDPVDQLERYLRWMRDGHLSSTGRCFGIGQTVLRALGQFQKTREPWSGLTSPHTAGNGSIMRLAPVAIAFATNPVQAVERAAESSRTTHGAATAVDACRYLACLLVGALQGVAKEELLSPAFWRHGKLAPEIAEIAAGSFRRKEPPEIQGTGFVVRSLEAALWALDRSNSFAEGALLAVNLGEDADTTGAVYGQLAGALFGDLGTPERWLELLAFRELIEQFADQLFAISQTEECVFGTKGSNVPGE